jgi:hypothetical protein
MIIIVIVLTDYCVFKTQICLKEGYKMTTERIGRAINYLESKGYSIDYVGNKYSIDNGLFIYTEKDIIEIADSIYKEVNNIK